MLETSCAAAWDVLQDPLGWPGWWRGVVRARELDGGDDRRVGSSYRVAWRSCVPYVLEFDFTVRSLEEGRWMEGEATGDLAGTGCWRLFEDAGVTAVVYEWDVTSTKRWMTVLGPLARPVFEYNHDAVMRWGGEGLARRLGVRLLAAG